MDILEGPSMLEFERDIVDDPMGSMENSDSPPYDPPARKRPLWLHDHYKILIESFPPKRLLEKVRNHAGTGDML